MKVDYFQVGAHVGPSNEDGIFNLITENKTVVLIKPVQYLYKLLTKNYKEKDKKNTIIFKDVAVSNKDGTIQLYVPSPHNNWSLNPSWASQLASVNEDHIKKHLEYLLVDRIHIPCYKLNTLISKMEISEIDTLVVDTEGHDYDILMDLDLTILKPRNITFENKHMDGVLCRGQRYIELMNHFKENGYVLVHEDRENTTIKLTE